MNSRATLLKFGFPCILHYATPQCTAKWTYCLFPILCLGEGPVTWESQLQSSEAFMCSLYTSAKKFSKLTMLSICQKNKTTNNLPPTSDSLSHHIKSQFSDIYLEYSPLSNAVLSFTGVEIGRWCNVAKAYDYKLCARRNCRVNNTAWSHDQQQPGLFLTLVW